MTGATPPWPHNNPLQGELRRSFDRKATSSAPWPQPGTDNPVVRLCLPGWMFVAVCGSVGRRTLLRATPVSSEITATPTPRLITAVKILLGRSARWALAPRCQGCCVRCRRPRPRPGQRRQRWRSRPQPARIHPRRLRPVPARHVVKAHRPAAPMSQPPRASSGGNSRSTSNRPRPAAARVMPWPPLTATRVPRSRRPHRRRAAPS
jgi:hypothetical protein